MAADPARDALKQVGLRALRELAESGVSDEHRLQAALGLVEWAQKVEWAEQGAALQLAAVQDGRRGR